MFHLITSHKYIYVCLPCVVFFRVALVVSLKLLCVPTTGDDVIHISHARLLKCDREINNVNK